MVQCGHKNALGGIRVNKQKDERPIETMESIADELRHAVKHLQQAIKKTIAYEERNEKKRSSAGRLQ